MGANDDDRSVGSLARAAPRRVARRLRLAVLLLLAAAAPAPPAIDRLLAALHAAATARDAGAIAARLDQAWGQAGTPAVTLLLRSGAAALAGGRFLDALRDDEAAVTLAPDLPAAHLRRALARLHLGQTVAAKRDLARSLALEPRYFPALELEARLAAGRGDWVAAVAAWRRVLAIAPRLPGGAKTLRRFLRHEAGQQT